MSGFAINDAFAAYFESDVVMEKTHGDDLIFVSEKNTSKLVERGYAQHTIDFAKICDTRIIDMDTFDSNCHFIQNDDGRLCTYLINSTDTSCLWEFDKPDTIKECKMLFRINSVYYFGVLYSDNLITNPGHFASFAYLCGGMKTFYDIPDQGYDTNLRVKMMDNYKFIFLDGIPQSMTFGWAGGNDSYPPQFPGGGEFQSDKYHYEYIAHNNGHFVWVFEILKAEKLEQSE